MPAIVQVEPLTTARALRGPFDYLRPEGAAVGLGAPRALRAPRGPRGRDRPGRRLRARRRGAPSAPGRRRARRGSSSWRCGWPTTRARPPRGRSRSCCRRGAHGRRPRSGPSPAEPRAGDERLTDRQRALLASLPRAAGADLAALRRLEARGLVALGPRAVRRAPRHTAVGARGRRPALTADQEGALQAIAARSPASASCCTASRGRARPRFTSRAAAGGGAGRGHASSWCPRSPHAADRRALRRALRRTVAVLHSRLTDGERHDEWTRLRSGEARVCVGPRSAVFAPIERLGLIVVDEEHDGAYKHEGDPRYDARQVAERRAQLAGACSRGQRRRARRASTRCGACGCRARVDGPGLPPVAVVDMRSRPRRAAPADHEALVDARKAIVLLNRRGWSNFLTCRFVRARWTCPSCDVTLVLHRACRASLACHHCGHREPVPGRCPSCAFGLDRPPRDGDRAPGERARRPPARRSSGSTRTSGDAASHW